MGNSTRRNGLDAACEPCRKSKLRCDHARPVCGRCCKRSLRAKCHYHPAPLTRKADGQVDRTRSNQEASSVSVQVGDTPSTQPTRPNSVRELAPAEIRYAANPRGTRYLDLSTPALWSIPRNNAILEAIVGILDALRDFDSIKSAVTEYYRLSKSAWIPGPLLLSALDSLQSLTGYANLFDDSRAMDNNLNSLAQTVWTSTARAMITTADMTPTAFMALFTGANLRLEYMGLLFSVAARSRCLWMVEDQRASRDFVERMFNRSTACLALSRRVAPINLATVWLSFDHMLLCSNIHGDTNEIVWHRMGDVSNDVLALGLHREANNESDVPYWLAECRRKMFIKAYTTDVSHSEVFSRPPRLLRRFSDCYMPLDLKESLLLAGPAEFERAKQDLNCDGWDSRGECFPGTNSRLRCILVEIREELLRFEFEHHNPNIEADLAALLMRNRQSYQQLPSHLKYTSSPSPPILSTTRLMIGLTYLAFLNTDLEIFRIQERAGLRPDDSATRVASESLAVVVELGAFREKPINTCDRSRIMFSYGLPAAIVLTSSLVNLSRRTTQPSQLPHGVTWSSLVRDLSVYVSQLKTTAVFGKAGYEVATQASRAISRTLDDVLDASFTQTQPPPAAAHSDLAQQFDGTNVANLPNFEASADLGVGTLDLWTDFDVDAWLSDVEKTAPGEAWSFL